MWPQLLLQPVPQPSRQSSSQPSTTISQPSVQPSVHHRSAQVLVALAVPKFKLDNLRLAPKKMSVRGGGHLGENASHLSANAHLKCSSA